MKKIISFFVFIKSEKEANYSKDVNIIFLIINHN